jgi:hypothetical protein
MMMMMIWNATGESECLSNYGEKNHQNLTRTKIWSLNMEFEYGEMKG